MTATQLHTAAPAVTTVAGPRDRPLSATGAPPPTGGRPRWAMPRGRHLTLALLAALWCTGAVAGSPAGAAGGVALGLSQRLRPQWRRRVQLVLVVTLIARLAYSGQLPDLPGMVTGVTGLLIGAMLFRRSRTATGDGDAARARRLLATDGGSSLSYLTLWRGNDYWFTSDGQAAVAYRVIASVAITTGDPIGALATRSSAVAGFTRFCADNGWTPCFYSVGEAVRETTAAMGWRAVQVAEEAVLSLPELAFTGRRWQDIRTALNKAGKQSITARWCNYREAPPALTAQIREISEQWVADKGMPEMGFTLGGLDELADDDVRCLVAVDESGLVHGVTSWLPVYQAGEIIGWTLDFMRRRREGFPGVMEFLIASAALRFRDEGARFVSLSGAPLARVDRGDRATGLQRLLDVAGQALEPVYGFRSLLAFKAKFQPSYHPLYLAYPDPAALPRIATAITRAYLPRINPRQTARLLRRLARPS